MSTAALANLPEEFLLHTQSTRKEPWSHYVLVRKTTNLDGKTRITISPKTTILVPLTEPAHYSKGSTVYLSDSALQKLPILGSDSAVLHVVSFKRCMTTHVQVHSNAAAPTIIPILYTSKYRSLIGKGVSANFNALPSPPPVASPLLVASPPPVATPPPPPIITIPSPTMAPPLALSTIEHVVPPPMPPKKKKPVAFSTSGSTMLVPFVAKQLLALAQLRHDQCPIIAEEYSEGNTAVMPCGHLFAQIAIEESFKKMPRVCPACRAHGLPTYV